MLTDECGEAGRSIRTTEATDWAESKWQWRHLCGEKTFSASKRVNSRRKKKAPRDAATAVGVRAARPNHSRREEGKGGAKKKR